MEVCPVPPASGRKFSGSWPSCGWKTLVVGTVKVNRDDLDQLSPWFHPEEGRYKVLLSPLSAVSDFS